MARGKAAIGFCHRDDAVNPWFAISLADFLAADALSDKRFKGRRLSICSGPMIDRARNDLVNAFLSSPDTADWLLMVDSDMTFTIDDVRRLFACADATTRPIVGGLCFASTPAGTWPTMIRFLPNGLFERLTSYPRNALVPVDATGCAFLLIHRSIFTRMADAARPEEKACPWFAVGYTADGRYFGEDVTFFSRLRRIGVQPYVHTGIRIGHMKTVCVNEDYYDLTRPTGIPVELPTFKEAS